MALAHVLKRFCFCRHGFEIVRKNHSMASGSFNFCGQTFAMPRESSHKPDLSPHHRPGFFDGYKDKNNIILMGAPGSGKTSIARRLSAHLNMPMVDIDDDVLERTWGTSVAKKLAELGDEEFLKAEMEATNNFNFQHSIIALSGSNPLSSAVMERMAQIGVIVYLDVDNQCILNRCDSMKVDRIVGQHSKSLLEILQHRRTVYENSYDIRVIVPRKSCTQNDNDPSSLDDITKQVLERLKDFSHQKYLSTRGFDGKSKGVSVELLDVIREGLAPDRGLYVAQQFAPFKEEQLMRLLDLSYPEVALRVLERFPLGSLHPSTLRELLYWAYTTFDDPAVLPVKHIEGHHYSIETFHGPTASFKDLSLQLLPALMHHSVKTDTRMTRSEGLQSEVHNTKVGLLVATSGDTGTAALSGFARHPASGPVIVLYPQNGVSIVQKAQMLTTGGSVLVLGVDADFDFCQTLVKDILNDEALNTEFKMLVPGLIISSANSMNFGRFVPQVVYSFYAYLQLVKQCVISMGQPVDLSIPTGNFGNLLAAVYARRLGIPIRRLFCASNENNILADFISSGKYDLRSRKFKQTISPSIDILVSSNLERFIHMLSGQNPILTRQLFGQLDKERHFELPIDIADSMRKELIGGWASEEECIATIRSTFERTSKLIDPHTAVAKRVAEVHSPLTGDSTTPMLIMSTAHWGKFPPTMLTALGMRQREQNTIPINGLGTEIGRAFKELMSRKPHADSYLHKELEHLTMAPIKHHHVVAANRNAIVAAIKSFLIEYNSNHQQLSQMQRYESFNSIQREKPLFKL